MRGEIKLLIKLTKTFAKIAHNLERYVTTKGYNQTQQPLIRLSVLFTNDYRYTAIIPLVFAIRGDSKAEVVIHLVVRNNIVNMYLPDRIEKQKKKNLKTRLNLLHRMREEKQMFLSTFTQLRNKFHH